MNENIDLDFFGWFDLKDIIRRLKYWEFILHYSVPNKRKDYGWKVVDDDSRVMEIVRKHQSCGKIKIYVKHLFEKPLLGKTPPPPQTK